ncbi:hypothetical protein AMS59_20745 [Lysinibacillus sp. FJAT-14745]|uniref:hypothetical protein n=1 Tax=Lysinibacillus sp. FJAT-14745 TaxID=1704289 RepID=UPI0006ABBCE5|nr:hypothetical protein [Lysinibacillus sp. FJAT-14745]KOP70254.1 hypothetical protein AMS59_20745 [Lysinibacillus sp. FJAT-14745]
MKKRFLIVLLLTGALINISINETVNAQSSDSPQPLEEFFPKIGYKTVESALKDFEQHYKKELKLPLRVPPISFTHRFGRFNNLDGDMNDTFELTMISDQFPQNHFKIDVRPVQHKIPFKKYISKVLKLKNGSDAAYINNPRFGFNMLVFERDGWQYMFGVDRDVSDKVTSEVLIEIANSIDYTNESIS